VRSKSTLNEYHTTKKYLDKWGYEIGTFADFLLTQPKMVATPQHKHLRQAITLAKEENQHWNLGTLHRPTATPSPMFSDDDFQTLCTACDDCDYPKFIEPGQRSRYWYTLIHFAAVTALRREAILGMNIGAVNFNEHFVTVDKTIDKKEKVRYKPITPELAADILNLRRFYDNSLMVPALRKRIFPWTHGNKRWYICWNAAEQKVGKRFHLHDLKRFSGELVLRAGATPLELQQHMDHANIATTLLYYCRPQTTNLIRRIRVPLPDKCPKITPLFTEPELRTTIESILVSRRGYSKSQWMASRRLVA
jgi:integrase